MDLPGPVRIGLEDYEIELIPASEAEARDKWGEALICASRIRIAESLSRIRASEVLLHEILHCLWWDKGLQRKDSEERILRNLSLGLAVVWRDNPNVMEWIAKGLGG